MEEQVLFEDSTVKVSVRKEASAEPHVCQCGRKVCCGKHKCTCHAENKIRFVKGDRSR